MSNPTVAVLEVFRKVVEKYYGRNVSVTSPGGYRASVVHDVSIDGKKLESFDEIFTPEFIPCAFSPSRHSLQQRQEIFGLFMEELEKADLRIHGPEMVRILQLLQSHLFHGHSGEDPSIDDEAWPITSSASVYASSNRASSYKRGDVTYEKIVFGDPVVRDLPDDEKFKYVKEKKRKRTRVAHVLLKLFPIAEWLPKYHWKTGLKDLIAGLTVACTLVPQALAYADLAHLPPQYGLYASFIPQMIYAVLGTSRQAALGPVAVISLLIGGVTKQTDYKKHPMQAVNLAVVICFVAGMINFCMGVLRLGWIVDFLSHPVLIGFMIGAGLNIGISQLKDIFGIKVPTDTANGPPYQNLGYILTHLYQTKWETFVFAIVCIIFLTIITKINRRFKLLIPGPLIVIVSNTIVSAMLKLPVTRLAVVGNIPTGLPAPSVPAFDEVEVSTYIGGAISVALIGYMETISIGKQFARINNYKIDPNQELIAIGASNVVGSFFSGYSICVSFSRTAINAAAGAQTNMTKFVSALVVVLSLYVLTPLLYWLPKASLAAIIMSAVVQLMDFGQLGMMWKLRKIDFVMSVLTTLFTFFLGVELGIGVAIAVSLAWVLYELAAPRVSVLGLLPGTNVFKDIGRFGDSSHSEGVLVLQLQTNLYFFNINRVRAALKRAERKVQFVVQCVVLDWSRVSSIDTNVVVSLKELASDYRKRGILLLMVGVQDGVLDVLDRARLRTFIGPQHFFKEVAEAVDHAKIGSKDGTRTLGFESGAFGSSFLVRFPPPEVFEEGGGI